MIAQRLFVLEGCETIMQAQRNLNSQHVLGKREEPRQMLKKTVQQGRSA